MKIYNYRTDMPRLDGERVMALGFFDGVHIGHRRLLDVARREAREKNLTFSVFTFADSSEIKRDTGRLYSDRERFFLIEECGADEIVVAGFDDMKNLAPESFAKDFLCGVCSCRVAITGKDFRFGKGATADADALAALMKESGGKAIAIDDVMLYSKKVSTTAIKEYLKVGDTVRANEMLGAPYFIRAEVEHGRGVGKTLGFPTLNCNLESRRGILRRGVYRSSVIIGGKCYDALTNVGTCPTFSEREEHAETYILDFKGELYGEEVRINLLKFLRDEMQFSSENELKMQINIDINRVKNHK